MKVIGCKIEETTYDLIQKIIKLENKTNSDFLKEAIDYYLNHKKTLVNQLLTTLKDEDKYDITRSEVDGFLKHLDEDIGG